MAVLSLTLGVATKFCAAAKPNPARTAAAGNFMVVWVKCNAKDGGMQPWKARDGCRLTPPHLASWDGNGSLIPSFPSDNTNQPSVSSTWDDESVDEFREADGGRGGQGPR